MANSTTRDPRYRLFYGLLSNLSERHRPIMLRQVPDDQPAPQPDPDPATTNATDPATATATAVKPVQVTKTPSVAVQVLEIDDDGAVFVQVPGSPEERQWLMQQSAVDMQVNEADARWSARSRRGALVELHLEANVVVPAVRLEPPEELVSLQRRAHYRVDTSQMDLPPVTVRLMHDTPKGLRPVKGPAIEARLMNISAGGVGLLIDPKQEAARNIFKSRQYQCRLHLPGQEDPVIVEACLVHVFPQKRKMLYLGMVCQWSTSTYGQRQAERFARAVTRLERETLRQRRRQRPLRIDTTNIDLPPVRVERILDDEQADPGPMLEARLMNVSVGGIGLLLDPTQQPALQVLTTRHYRCHVPLVGSDETLPLPLRLAHCYPQAGQCVYIGLACRWDLDDEGDTLAARFAAAVEDFKQASRRAAAG